MVVRRFHLEIPNIGRAEVQNGRRAATASGEACSPMPSPPRVAARQAQYESGFKGLSRGQWGYRGIGGSGAKESGSPTSVENEVGGPLSSCLRVDATSGPEFGSRLGLWLDG